MFDCWKTTSRIYEICKHISLYLDLYLLSCCSYKNNMIHAQNLSYELKVFLEHVNSRLHKSASR